MILHGYLAGGGGGGKQEDVFIYSQVNNAKTLMSRHTGSYNFLPDLVFVWIIPVYQLQNISFFTYFTFIAFLSLNKDIQCQYGLSMIIIR